MSVMTRVVNHELAGLNADVLERALAAGWKQLVAIDGDDERQRRAEALSHIEGYMALLREPSRDGVVRQKVRYVFKLVFPDGRWSIDEKQLADRPAAGDVVVFEGHGGWRIEHEDRVGVRPAGKPPREFFVCAPAA
jgi:hypothetical protein